MTLKSNRTKILSFIEIARRNNDPHLVDLITLVADDLHNTISSITPFITIDGIIFNHLSDDPPGTLKTSKFWSTSSGFFYRIGTGKVRHAFPTPHCAITKTITQLIPHAAQTLLTWDSEVYDSHDLHSNTVNNSRITVKIDGHYYVLFSIHYAANSSDDRAVYVLVNGVNVAGAAVSYHRAALVGPTILSGCIALPSLIKGDYVELSAYQDSGVALNVMISSRFSLLWHS